MTCNASIILCCELPLMGFHMGVAKNRKVSIDGKEYTQLQELEIPEQGLVVYLKKFGQVKVFWKTFKNEIKSYYIMYLPKVQEIERITRQEFKQYGKLYPTFRTLYCHKTLEDSKRASLSFFTEFSEIMKSLFIQRSGKSVW